MLLMSNGKDVVFFQTASWLSQALGYVASDVSISLWEGAWPVVFTHLLPMTASS